MQESISYSDLDVDYEDLKILQDHLHERHNGIKLGLPKSALKDNNGGENFASYSSGYLSQESFVDLTKPDLESINNKVGLSIAVPNLEYHVNQILKEQHRSHKKYTDDKSLSTNYSTKGSKPDEEYTQEMILPDSLSNEDEPMVLITKPCLPPGKKARNSLSDSKPGMSTSKTVTDLRNQLSLERDKKKNNETSDCKSMLSPQPSIFNSFSHLELSASVPYNLSEEPADCNGMSHSQSYQSNTSASDELQHSPASLQPKFCDIEHKQEHLYSKDQIFPSPGNSEEKRKNECSEEVVSINQHSFSPSHVIRKSKTNCEQEKHSKGKLNVIDDSLELEHSDIKNNAENQVEKKEAKSASMRKESLEQKRTREQKILSQKLDEFRKNSRSTKADQIRICTNRQMRAKSEDIIVKPSITVSKKNNGIDTNQNKENLGQKCQTESFGTPPKNSDVDKEVLKQKRLKQHSLDRLEMNRRRLQSDSSIKYDNAEKASFEDTKTAKVKKISCTEILQGNCNSSKGWTHKLSAPQLVQAMSLNSSLNNPRNLNSEKKNPPKGDSRNLHEKSKELGVLPSPPVEFKDLPKNTKSENIATGENEKKEIKSSHQITCNIQPGESEQAETKDKCSRYTSNSKNMRVNNINKVLEQRDDATTENICESKETVSDDTQHDIQEKVSENKVSKGNLVKERKNNLFSNYRIPNQEEECTLSLDISKNHNMIENKTSIGSQETYRGNELFVVQRRGSDVDCLESTPLPSPNLSEKSKLNAIDLYASSQTDFQPSPAHTLTASRLGVKR